jgi:signal transduction histidine kinase
VAHAARVAVVATLIIIAIYACVVAGFNAVDRHRLIGQIDTRLDQRLEHAARHPASAGSIADYDNAHDVDDAAVFLWRVGGYGVPKALTSGAPTLPASVLPAANNAADAQVGTTNFRLQSRRVGSQVFVAGQSLAAADHVESDLVALELIAGPLLLLAVFLGTLLIGIKAAGPVEQTRRRQLEFTADASHELRTPLSVIEAEVSLALAGTRTADDYRETLRRVSRESLRLRDIVEDLLWLSRFDSEPPPPGDQPVDLSAIAEACVDRFLAVAQNRGIALSVHHVGDGQPWIKAPPEWIDRLVAVLVDNACRYAAHDGVVKVTVTAENSRVALAVSDDGPGIRPEDRASLFERFHRATAEGNGAGLGLAIGDAVVRATSGQWRISDSALGGAHIEVRWHRAGGAKGSDGRDALKRKDRSGDRHPTEPSVVR